MIECPLCGRYAITAPPERRWNGHEWIATWTVADYTAATYDHDRSPGHRAKVHTFIDVQQKVDDASERWETR